MFAYILRKLFYMPFILLGVIFITFVLFQMSTTPEALAKIQLGEKASPRVIYEWLVSKGHASWTAAGRDKLARLADGDLHAKETQFFVDGDIARLADERDEVASRIESLRQSINELANRDRHSERLQRMRGEMAGLLRRQAANRIQIKDALLAARRVEASTLRQDDSRRLSEEQLSALYTMDGHLIDREFLEDELRVLNELDMESEAQRNERQTAWDGFLAAAEGKAALWKKYEPVRDKVSSLEDIAADLSYTAWYVTFWHYVADTVTLDFGDNNRRRPVMDVIREGIGPSLMLTLPAFLIAELIGVFFGLMAAMYRQTKIDHVIVISAILLMSINSIALIMGGQKVFAAEWHLFPISGFETSFSAARFLILPILLYVLLAFGERVRFARIIMLDETNQDYVRTARAKGLGENRVLFKHILRNTLIPLITRWVVAIPTLYLGSLVLESFFGIPGLGYLTIDAVSNSDANVIRAIVVIGSVGFMLANLLSDVLYAVVDPRVRLE